LAREVAVLLFELVMAVKGVMAGLIDKVVL